MNCILGTKFHRKLNLPVLRVETILVFFITYHCPLPMGFCISSQPEDNYWHIWFEVDAAGMHNARPVTFYKDAVLLIINSSKLIKWWTLAMTKIVSMVKHLQCQLEKKYKCGEKAINLHKAYQVLDKMWYSLGKHSIILIFWTNNNSQSLQGNGYSSAEVGTASDSVLIENFC